MNEVIESMVSQSRIYVHFEIFTVQFWALFFIISSVFYEQSFHRRLVKLL